MEVRTRFAPSPTGYMHIGNLRTALYNYLYARNQKGKFVLRIEDTDQKRLVEDSVDVIYRSLETAGMKADESARIGGEFGPYVQSERKEIYKKYAFELVEKGFAYFCFCGSEEKDEAQGNSFGYNRKCRDLSKAEIEANLKAGKPFVIRQKMPLEGTTSYFDEVYGEITVDNKTLEDQVLFKSDGLPTYNFANVVDDHLMNITHILRGHEYVTSTPKYELLYRAFGWESPKVAHLSTIMCVDENGVISKLSKRHGSVSFEDLISEGYLVGAILNYIALLGWSPKMEREIFSLDELCEIFSLDGIVKSNPIFDYAKLAWFNGEYIKALSDEAFNEYAMPIVSTLPSIIQEKWNYLSQFIKPRINNRNEIAEKVKFFYDYPQFDLELFVNKKNKTNLENSKQILEEVLPLLEDLQEWNTEKLNELLANFAESKEVKLGYIMWPVRIAISGQTVTPCGSGEILYVLGKNESLRRIKESIKRL